MIGGWTYVDSSPARHYFVGDIAICNSWIIDDLDPAELEQEQQEGVKYCKLCLRKVARARELGIEPEPPLTDDQRAYLRFNWPNMTAVEMAEKLGIQDELVVKAFCSRELPPKGVNTGGFQKGLVPWNQGMKGYRAPGSEKGWFKKGHLPANTLYDGAITVREDNRGVPQQMIRTGLGEWEYLSRYLWVQAHGPIPEGYVVAFKDKDTLNCVLENLELITKAENLGRNSGRKELTDQYVARKFSQVGRGRIDTDLQNMVLALPMVLQAKREHLQTRRVLQQLDSATDENS
jgi:hypothetical protein